MSTAKCWPILSGCSSLTTNWRARSTPSHARARRAHPIRSLPKYPAGTAYRGDDFELTVVDDQLRRAGPARAAHSDLNRLSTAGRLCCADVALRVSIDCYRPVAAAGRRAG